MRRLLFIQFLMPCWFVFVSAFIVSESAAQSTIGIVTAETKTPILSLSDVEADYVVTGEEGRWKIIRFNQSVIPVWVSLDYVQIDNANNSVLVLANNLNARILPSLNSGIVSQIGTGYTSEILEIKDGFVKIIAPNYFQYAVDSQELLVSDRAVAGEVETVRSNSGWVMQPKEVSSIATQNIVVTNSPEPIESLEPIENIGSKATAQSSFTQQNTINSSTDSRANSKTIFTSPIQPVSVNQQKNEQYRLAAGDSISVTVFGESDLNLAATRVPQSGVITFPLIGSVQIVGKTTQEIEVSLISAYSQGYIKNPTLTVAIEGYRPIFIRGAVGSTGSFDYSEGLTVAQALSLAGGTKKTAKPFGVSIERDGQIIQQGISLNSNIAVTSGDVLTVDEEVGFSEEGQLLYVYLHGEVKSPGEYQYRPGLTVEKAVVLAGGFGLRASKRKISVSRYIDGQEIPEIMKKVPLYLPVEPGDIINVGASWF